VKPANRDVLPVVTRIRSMRSPVSHSARHDTDPAELAGRRAHDLKRSNVQGDNQQRLSRDRLGNPLTALDRVAASGRDRVQTLISGNP
jgi:hypothetical protein